MAWEISKPALYGPLHLLLGGFVILLAVIAARIGTRLSYDKRICLLSIIGWLLLVSEVFKQLFLYYIINDGHFSYWFIPFQLCSVPMYLCILLPLSKGSIRESILTFMATYTFISAIATFIYPEDILRPYLILTLHGFDWHGVLLLISLLIVMTGMADFSFKGFMRATYLFAGLCTVASVINIATEPAAAAAGYIRGYANMFYISPYHPSYQPVVSSIEASPGRIPAIFFYITAIIIISGIFDLIFSKTRAYTENYENKRSTMA